MCSMCCRRVKCECCTPGAAHAHAVVCFFAQGRAAERQAIMTWLVAQGMRTLPDVNTLIEGLFRGDHVKE